MKNQTLAVPPGFYFCRCIIVYITCMGKLLLKVAGNLKLGAFDPVASVMYSSHLTFYAPSIGFYSSSVGIYTSTEAFYAPSVA